ncbi:MAG: DUF2723 domain-containing protein [Tannerella sp.]|jgi:hypothetical protein|nr:DUF2723 domain-containing protein [Tannerella sp.]
MKKFQLANNLLGLIVFAIAATVYLMTIEPSVSFWDCGEFITSSYKLEVGHPPGAPFFMLVANVFSHFSEPANVAKMVNSMSAVCSALTILFLFWTITHLTRRLAVKSDRELALPQAILILGCGLVGSLAYTFSDTFWFSAVEGEVYASSSLFTAVVFWLILKWEEHADKAHADRWIILIAYLMGLSIGIHLLNLLCIPAIVLVYYYKKYPSPTPKGTVYALLVSFAMIFIMLYGIVQGLVEVCGWFELLFVNGLGMPYNTGVFIYVLTVAGVLGWSVWETMRTEINARNIKISFILAVSLLGIPFVGSGYLPGVLLIAALTLFMFRWYKKVNVKALNTILVSLFVIVIGYSTFALILIRATSDTPMNQNKPDNIFALRGYLAREQYGENPLIYGRTYVSEIKRELKGRYYLPVTTPGVPTWTRVIKENTSEKDRYFISATNDRVEYIDETCMLFPRMWSNNESEHVENYKSWGEVKGIPVKITAGNGETTTVMRPAFVENLRFLFSYQLNFMYWRYFMWNFAGRQNDKQCYGDILNGNWITGIPLLDEPRLGPQDNMPFDIANNKGHNKYYLLPLLLGIAGILFQVMKKDERGIQSFWIIFMLFFMTGVAIVLYLNQYAFQPRERDYAFAGSFYAYCIWIGIGVAGVAQLIEKAGLNRLVSGSLASLLCLLIPLQMVSQTWDDHDRSGRYIARDVGRNYLESCEPDAIIFTHGDNDTFPLWYVQEVEGVRTDVRVCNTSYLQTDWYINQMKRQAYNSEPLPISWEYKEYIYGKRDYIYIIAAENAKPVSVGTALTFIKSDSPKSKIDIGNEMHDYLPADKLTFRVDSAAVAQNRVVNPEYLPYILPELNFNFAGKNGLSKVDAITLDMLNTNKWERPMYYARTVPPSVHHLFEGHLQLTGLAMQIVPLNTNDSLDLYYNTRKMYDNVMNKFRWGGLEKPGLYLEQTTMNMCTGQRSYIFAALAEKLIKEGKPDDALRVLDRCVEVMPDENVPYLASSFDIAQLYLQLEQVEKAKKIGKLIIDRQMTSIDWMLRLKPSLRSTVLNDLGRDLEWTRRYIITFNQFDKDFAQSYMDKWNQYYNKFSGSQKK